MHRYATLFFFVAVFAVVTAEQNEIPRIASPMTHILVQDELHTAMRPTVDKTFRGRIMGKMITDLGHARYKGSFSGTKMGKKVKADFNYRVRGTSTMPGFTFKAHGDVHGNMHAHGKKVTVQAKFDARLTGMVAEKKMMGRMWGDMRFRLRNTYFEIAERGRFDFMVGAKRMVGTYKAVVDSNMVKVDIRGLYGGKRFFVRYMLSTNVLKLIYAGKNPFIVRRNYGTIVLHARGKKTIRKFDVKGWEFPMLK